MGHRLTLILLKIHFEIVENYTFRQNDQFWPYLEKSQQVGYKLLCRLKNSAPIYGSYKII